MVLQPPMLWFHFNIHFYCPKIFILLPLFINNLSEIQTQLLLCVQNNTKNNIIIIKIFSTGVLTSDPVAAGPD